MDSIVDHPVINRLVQRLYGRPLIRNVLRGELVEQMILDALGTEWSGGNDYESWDVRHAISGITIQIKQSAARQSWASDGDSPSTPKFSIAKGLGYSSERRRWDDPAGRRSDLYVFAWHAGIDGLADHRDVAQWEFHVVSTARLPDAASITLAGVRRLAASVSHEELAAAVERQMP